VGVGVGLGVKVGVDTCVGMAVGDDTGVGTGVTVVIFPAAAAPHEASAVMSKTTQSTITILFLRVN
jgi:hypothetical protein